jgi:hypothetical protein
MKTIHAHMKRERGYMISFPFYMGLGSPKVRGGLLYMDQRQDYRSRGLLASSQGLNHMGKIKNYMKMT